MKQIRCLNNEKYKEKKLFEIKAKHLQPSVLHLYLFIYFDFFLFSD